MEVCRLSITIMHREREDHGLMLCMICLKHAKELYMIERKHWKMIRILAELSHESIRIIKEQLGDDNYAFGKSG